MRVVERWKGEGEKNEIHNKYIKKIDKSGERN